MNEEMRQAIEEVLVACHSATSKLESQVARNPDLPASYATITNESFNALWRLRAAYGSPRMSSGEVNTPKLTSQTAATPTERRK